MKISSLQKGLVGHWTMAQDSLKGSLLADKTPYENDGTINGATFTTDRKGKANSAMSFDGTDDYIDCGNDSSLSIKECVSISLWIKFLSHPVGHLLDGIAGKNNGNIGYYLRYYQNTIRFVAAFDGIAGNYVEAIGTSLENNEWYNIVGTYDKSTVKIYINGVLIDGKSFTKDIGEVTRSFTLGMTTPWTSWLDGSMNDVRVYNRALSEPEIKTLYNSYNPKIIL